MSGAAAAVADELVKILKKLSTVNFVSAPNIKIRKMNCTVDSLEMTH